MSSAAAMASAASGIARRSRVCSLDGLARSRSFRASSPASPSGVAGCAGSLHSAAGGSAPPRLMRCRSLTSAPSAGRRAYAGAARVTSAVRRGEGDFCGSEEARAEGGRFLAGAATVAVAGAFAASATRQENQAGLSDNGQAKAGGGGIHRSSAAGGAGVWCHGSASTRFPASLGSFGDRAAASRRADLRKNSWSSTSSSSSSGSGGGGGGESDVEQVDVNSLHGLDPTPAAGKSSAGTTSVRITDVYRFEGNGEPVGRGNRSVVSTATHRLTGQPVAVKRLSRAETTRLEVMEEVNMLKVAGRHPNVVTMQAFFEDREAYYIVMEMCEGGELYHRLADKGRYSEGQAARIMAEVASAVGFLHGKGIIHFDLKPENIMLAVGGDDCVPEVRLADFGSAFRQYRQIRIARDYTAAYSAPEVLARESVDEKVDMWALGVVMWIMLTGQHPFGANSDLSEAEVARRVTEMEPDLKVLRHVSPEGKDLVRRLLARDPEDRPSARRVLSHPWLRAVVTRSKAPNPAATVAPRHPRLARRLQQQHQRHSRPLEGSWGRVVPTPRVVGTRSEASAGVGTGPGNADGEEGKGGGGGGAGGLAEASTVAAVVASVTGGDHLSA